MDPLDWLLAGDPAVRWQALRDLTDASAADVAAARAEVTETGWGAALLAARDPEGGWAGGAFWPADFSEEQFHAEGQAWTATFHTLWLLLLFGAEPASAPMLAAERGAATLRWEEGEQAFFDGEVEPCINGRTVGIGTYLGHDMSALVERLLGERLEDGGWNCEAPHNSAVSSFDTTINVLEGLTVFRDAHPDPRVDEAIDSGAEYLLRRGLFRRLGTGEPADADFLLTMFPSHWRYSTLRALDWMRWAGLAPDERIGNAVELLRAKRLDDGRWPLDLVLRGRNHLAYEPQGEPSRWVTLQAMRVLRWADAGAGTGA